MMKKFLCVAAAIILHFSSIAQEDSLKLIRNDSLPVPDSLKTSISTRISGAGQPIYKLKPAVDIPLFVADAVWSGYAFTKIYSKDRSSEEKILGLNKNDI